MCTLHKKGRSMHNNTSNISLIGAAICWWSLHLLGCIVACLIYGIPIYLLAKLIVFLVRV
jgi:hypothetical protein